MRLVALAFLALFSISSLIAAERELNRAEARRLLTAYMTGEVQFWLPLYREPVAMTELQIIGRDKLYEPWINAGLVRFGEKRKCPDCLPMPGVTVELTPKGEEALKSSCAMRKGCSLLDNYLDAAYNGRRHEFTLVRGPLGDRSLDEITGITHPAQNTAVVEFTISVTGLTQLARMIGVRTSQRVRIEMVRYDDGWRINNSTLRYY
jgi:hypothetical protein